MSDLISRRAAIDAINELHDKPNAWLDLAVDALEKLLSTQPVGCNGCRYDWFGDPRCAKCARSFQDHYEERKEK